MNLTTFTGTFLSLHYMSITDTLREGTTYAGHPFHIVLNYSVLFLVLVPHFFLLKRRSRGWLVLFLLFTVIQVGLWFTNGAVGISLIWCGLAGYNLLLFFQYRKEGAATAFLLFSPLVATGAIVFYYLYFPVVTTIAHVSAFLFGLALGFRVQRRQKKNA